MKKEEKIEFINTLISQLRWEGKQLLETQKTYEKATHIEEVSIRLECRGMNWSSTRVFEPIPSIMSSFPEILNGTINAYKSTIDVLEDLKRKQKDDNEEHE